MPLLPSAYHTDFYLTNYVLGYDNRAMDSVAMRAFTRVPVNQQSGIYLTIPKGGWFRDEARVRPLTGTAEMAKYATSTGTYYAEEYALRHLIDDRVRANNNSPLGLDEAGSNFLMRKMQIRRDLFWAASWFKTGVWGTDVAGVSSGPSGSQFLQFDQSGSDPIALVWQYKEAVALATGFTPNVLVIGNTVFTKLVNHAALVNRILYNQGGVVTRQLMASLFGVDEIIVPSQIYNSAGEGQSDSMTYIVNGKAMLLLYRAPVATLDGSSPTGGVIWTWDNLVPGQTNADGAVIMRRRAEEHFSDEILARSAWGQSVIATDVGVFFSAVLP